MKAFTIKQNFGKIKLKAFVEDKLNVAEPFTPYILILMHQQKTAFENIVGEGKIARNEQFLLFPQCF